MHTKWVIPSTLFIVFIASLFYVFQRNLPQLQIEANLGQLPVNELAIDFGQANLEVDEWSRQYDQMQQTLGDSTEIMSGIKEVAVVLAQAAEQNRASDAEQAKLVNDMVLASQAQKEQTLDALDVILSNILGKPIGQTFGSRATIKVFSLQEAGYQGYMAKVKLLDADAVRLVLSHDKVGDKGETTSAAAKRTHATLAINGGGFAPGDNGLLYPMGITVSDGEIVTFYRTDLSFIGFNKQGHLVGGDITTKEQIKELGVMQGATFVPTLLKDGKKLTIPSKYKNQKQPRTLIGRFSNGDLLFIVIDGRRKGYSDGVTLEEAQEKLLSFRVVDAYNLDGGGSSAFYYNGKVLNRPSDGRERSVSSNFIINAN